MALEAEFGFALVSRVAAVDTQLFVDVCRRAIGMLLGVYQGSCVLVLVWSTFGRVSAGRRAISRNWSHGASS